VAGGQMEKAKKATDIAVMDQDQSVSSKAVVDMLNQSNFKVQLYTGADENEIVKFAKDKSISVALVLPKGFEQKLSTAEPQKVKTYSILKNFSFTGSKDTAMLDAAITSLNSAASDQIIRQKLATAEPEKLKNPIQRDDKVVIGNKQAATSPTAVMGFVTSQTALIPIILFIVIIFAATMIATAIATEKENKTLETLLTAPVDRKYIVSAKMVGAGVVALLSAVVYIFGFRYYMDGLSGGAGNIQDAALKLAIDQLGLTFSFSGYLLLGGTLFLAILCALAIATILGAFAEDAKSANGLISPLMVLIMIPYFLTMFLDINTLSPAVKTLVYAIPFSYPFMAAPNIFLHNYSIIFYGMAYQAIMFIVFVYIASRIFSTDKIITLKLSFGKKRR
jgi:ABC-2 type transport system permease protein